MLVGDIDEPVVAAATRTPFEARRRVFVIERAETMNEQSQNKMLKTLEEPASFAHLILLSSRPGKLLPTISSRCQLVRFDAPEPEQLAERLVGRGGPRPRRRRRGRAPRPRRRRPRARRARAAPARRGLRPRRAAGDLRDAAVARAPRAGPAGGRRAQATVEERVAAELELLPKRDRRRAEREGAEAAKRAQRRARMAALDQGLELAGLWFRDVACVADGAPDARPRDRPARRARGRRRGPRRAPPARPRSRSSTRRARRSSSTRTRSCCSRRSPRGWRATVAYAVVVAAAARRRVVRAAASCPWRLRPCRAPAGRRG